MSDQQSKTTWRCCALNAVRVVSDPSPVVLLTASSDDMLATINIEAEALSQNHRGDIIRGSFGWAEARQFAEALLVIVADAEDRDRERARLRAEGKDDE